MKQELTTTQQPEQQKGIITICSAKKYKVEVKGHSWAAFIVTDDGDLFIDSDWGYWCYSWRGNGGRNSIQEFLISISADYLVGKLSQNLGNFGNRKMNPRTIEAVTALFEAFQQHLITEISSTEKSK